MLAHFVDTVSIRACDRDSTSRRLQFFVDLCPRPTPAPPFSFEVGQGVPKVPQFDAESRLDAAKALAPAFNVAHEVVDERCGFAQETVRPLIEDVLGPWHAMRLTDC